MRQGSQWPLFTKTSYRKISWSPETAIRQLSYRISCSAFWVNYNALWVHLAGGDSQRFQASLTVSCTALTAGISTIARVMQGGVQESRVSMRHLHTHSHYFLIVGSLLTLRIILDIGGRCVLIGGNLQQLEVLKLSWFLSLLCEIFLSMDARPPSGARMSRDVVIRSTEMGAWKNTPSTRTVLGPGVLGEPDSGGDIVWQELPLLLG